MNISDSLQTSPSTDDNAMNISDSSQTSSSTDDNDHSDHESHAYTPILFAFMTVFVGMLIKDLVPHSKLFFLRKIPYTGLVFLFWCLISAFNEQIPIKYLGVSISMWTTIDPHLLLFVFLPALLFGDAKAVDTHLLGRKIKEISILATFGVMIGTFLMALYSYYILPYSWSWEFSMVIGSILSATDPVAVVSLLNDLGAPAPLTLTVSGESMFNDGTAIVLFNLFLSLYSENSSIPNGLVKYAYTDPLDIAFYGVTACLGGAIIGLCGGVAIILMLLLFDSKLHEENSLLQLTTTISMSYLTFYISEGIWGFSGVIATVTAGIFFSEYSRGIIVSKEVLDAGWEMLEFMGNTMIFSLAGVISGKVLSSVDVLKYLSRYDFFYIIVSWFFSFLTRMVMLALVYPLIRFVRRNDPLSMQMKKNDLHDMIIQGWGGLRGAVGLALAMAVRNQNVGSDEEKNGTLLLIHVVGVAGLTLLINAPTATPLLVYLGVSEPSLSHRVAVKRIKEELHAEIAEFAKKMIQIQNDDGFDDFKITEDELGEWCHVLRPQNLRDRAESGESEEPSAREGTFRKLARKARRNSTKAMLLNKASSEDADAKCELRELFLKLVRSEYNNLIDHSGIILPAERHESSRLLLNSTLEALDDLSGLGDWKALQKSIEPKKRMMRFLNFVDKILRTKNNKYKRRFLYKKRQDAYATIQAFIIAHESAQQHIIDIFHEDAAVMSVVDESREVVREAMKMRKSMDNRVKKFVALDHLAARILIFERRKVVHLVENGVLTEADEEALLEENAKDFESMLDNEKKAREQLVRSAPSLADQRSTTIYKQPSIVKTISRRFNRSASGDSILSSGRENSYRDFEKDVEAEAKRKVKSPFANSGAKVAPETPPEPDKPTLVKFGPPPSELTSKSPDSEKDKVGRSYRSSFRATDTKSLNAAHMPAFHKAGSSAVIDFADRGQDLLLDGKAEKNGAFHKAGSSAVIDVADKGQDLLLDGKAEKAQN